MRLLGLLILASTAAFGAKKGETTDYICIGQGVGPNGRSAPSAETHVRITLPAGQKFDKLKGPTPATATLFGLQLHKGGKTQKLGKAVVVHGLFENVKGGPKAGHNFDATAGKAGAVRQIHIYMGNTSRNPSSLKTGGGKKLTEHYMLCQWQ